MDGPHELRAELATQAADVRVDGPLPRPVPPAPHLGQQLLAREHGAGPGGERAQQIELRGCEVLLAVAARRGGGLRVETQRADPDRLTGWLRPSLHAP